MRNFAGLIIDKIPLAGGYRPAVVTLVAEAGAAIVTLATVRLNFALTGVDLPIWVKLGLAGLVAGVIGYLFRAALPWIILLALLPALLVGALSLDLPTWIPVSILAILILVLRNSFGERVPLYLTNLETRQKLASLIPQETPVQFVDLGCGLADTVVYLAKWNNHPDSRFLGVENAPLPYLFARFAAWRARDHRIVIRWGSLWNMQLGEFDYVYAFLSPQPMPDLFEKARLEMHENGVFISNSFTVPDYPPEETIKIASGRATALMIWKPARLDNATGADQE